MPDSVINLELFKNLILQQFQLQQLSYGNIIYLNIGTQQLRQVKLVWYTLLLVQLLAMSSNMGHADLTPYN